MSFFDLKAYLQDRGGDVFRGLMDRPCLFGEPGDEQVTLFGRGGARRKAEQPACPFLGEVPLNIALREIGDEGRIDRSYADDFSRPYLLALVEQARRPDQHPEHQARPRCRSWRSSTF